MGIFDIFAPRRGRLVDEARAKEREGDLGRAVELYLEASAPDDAARVLLLRSDAEPSAERRMAFADNASRIAMDAELKKRALAQKADIALGVARAGGRTPSGLELTKIGADFEACGELVRAAEVYALSGDREAEVRVLAASGDVDAVEARLDSDAAAERASRDREATLQSVRDLNQMGRRREALETARAWLARHGDDALEVFVRTLDERVLRGPAAELEVEGRRARIVFGDEVIVGRGDGDIAVTSSAVSRRHLRLWREGGVAVVEDLGTRNGTTVAGARMAAPIPIGDDIAVELGGVVACSIKRSSLGGVLVALNQAEHLVPLGPLDVAGLRIEWVKGGERSFVVVHAMDAETPPVLGEFSIVGRVELAIGDEIRIRRDGAIVLRVISGSRG